MSMTIITYGGGDILKNIFNAVAMLMNGQTGSLFRPLMVLAASFGGIWALSKAFFHQSHEHLLGRYMLPMLVISGIFLIPTTQVKIEDVIQDKSCTVDHVPYLLGQFAMLASSVGHKITSALESVMHTPNDTNYNSTGMLFGSETSLEMNQYQITNADLEQNLRKFTKQCVLYDVALGAYSIDDLKKSSDLWGLFEEKTSKVRMMTYCDPTIVDSEKKCSYCTCGEALKLMKPYFEKEKKYFLQHDILKNLPLTFQALTGIRRDKEEIISQQLMMNVLDEEYGSPGFAKDRAYSQQRDTYHILGSLASKSLVTMRGVIEALIYAAFIFIMPMTLLPGGLSILKTWCGLVLWIQMWPPFFAILNYIMQTVAQSKAGTIFYTLSSSDQGLSFFTSVGLQNLQNDVFALAGYLSASIPFITYAVLKGGASSFVHLASSMMSPAHSASASAAAEQSTGNYSFGNASVGQTHYRNASAFQQNHAPSISSGHFTENKGFASTTHTPHETMIKQSNSDLRTSVFGDESIQASLNKAEQHAHSVANSTQQSYMESAAITGKELTSFSETISNNLHANQGYSNREGLSAQSSTRYLQSTAENWGKQYGLNQRESLEVLGSVGVTGGTGVNLGFMKFGANIEGKMSGNRQASRDDIMTSAQNVATSQDFQENLQILRDYSRSNSATFSQDEGGRLTEDLARSFDTVESMQSTHQAAMTELEQVSQTATWAQTHSSQVRQSYNQEFVNWAQEQYQDSGGYNKAFDTLTNPQSSNERDQLVRGFVQHIQTQSPIKDSGNMESSSWLSGAHKTINNRFTQQSADNLQDVQLNPEKTSSFVKSTAAAHGITRSSTPQNVQEVMQGHEKGETLVAKLMTQATNQMDSSEELQQEFYGRNDQILASRMLKGAEHTISKAEKGIEETQPPPQNRSYLASGHPWFQENQDNE